MAEWGAVEVHQLLDRFPATERTIEATSKIIDANSTVVGLALVSGNVPILCVWNCDDELYYGSFDAMTEQDWGARPRISDAAFAVK
ncbi:hypothetical protein LAC81_24005 [Ensifer adhaerens]|uniref:hypothetical protein n=1 Tax=Ensifer adhaerens TaxID=106592 RepID=UPI001CBFA56C|nr:hypothetical protein [Ensifer adhaerens]UAY03733.1 hypothetical protein LAC80_20480 [Ensifer adhaerens]UAY11717.1 hypothetical protein LAC81_24005 [Ensifer adhaerens]